MQGKEEYDFLEDFDLYGSMGGDREENKRVSHSLQYGENKTESTSGRENQDAGAVAQNQPPAYTPTPIPYNPSRLPPLDRTPMAKRRGGRVPRLMRAEVEMIRADARNVTDAAKFYGVSENTIRRVRELGCFKGVPYIPADEYDNTISVVVTPDGNERHINAQTPMSELVHGPAAKSGKKFGRPFAKRARPFNDAELYDIASSPNVRQLAEQYNVSRSTIHNIKRKMASMLPQGQSLIDVALNDPRPSSMLARQYGPYYGVNASWFDHVRQYGETPQPRDPSLPRGAMAADFKKAPVTTGSNYYGEIERGEGKSDEDGHD